MTIAASSTGSREARTLPIAEFKTTLQHHSPPYGMSTAPIGWKIDG
jgi:hypothetical protein